MIYYATINKPIKKIKTRHYKRDSKSQELMQFPDILIIEDEGVRAFLYRYTIEGEFAGDTWHPDLEEAKEQAEFEYEVTNDAWNEIPPDVKDYLPYIQNQIEKN